MIWPGVIKYYRDFLPVKKEDCIVTLLEGNTPLVPSITIVKKMRAKIHLFFKCEGFNPTGSFKDRGMTVAISRAKEDGVRFVICASTGNTSASAAAYAARAGMRAFVIIPEGKIALGKLSQAVMHGASVIQIRGNFDQALRITRQIADNYPVRLVNSLNPDRIEGQKTAAFEICDWLGGRAPDYHFLPVGNAGNITAYWKGYKEYRDRRITENLPKMMGFQAEGAAPIVRKRVIERPETVATAIRIGNPASWKMAEAARDESGGIIDMVSDDEILAAYRMISREEGIFCEPASGASLAGLLKLDSKGLIEDGSTVICTLTGHGLKDPDNAIKVSPPPVTLGPNIDEIVDYMGI